MIIEVLLKALAAGASNPLVLCFSTLAASILVFRVYYFWLEPKFNPSEIPFFPYWIPYIGHGLQFFNNFQGVFDAGRQYFRDFEKPFMLYVAGQRMLIVNSPRLVDQITNDNNTYSFDPFIRDLYDGLVQMSDQGHKTMWRTPAEGFRSLIPNPKGKPLVHIGLELFHKQLLVPERMEQLFKISFKEIDRLSQWDSPVQFGVIQSKGNTKVVSLYRWVRDLLIRTQADSFFGPEIIEMEPNLASLWDNWSLNSWMLSYGYPAFLTSSVTEPRDRMIATVESFLKISVSERMGGTPFVRELEAELKHAGLSDTDAAKVLVIVLSSDTTLTYQIRQELLEGLGKPSSLDTSTLGLKINKDLVDQCSLLRSAYNETLRISTTGCTIRKVTKPTTLEGKSVEEGTIVFMPQRSLLLAPQAFGTNADVMNPYRFQFSKKLERSEFFRPFGSGITLCSGRIIGRHQILSMVALTLLRFDLRVVAPSERVLGVRGKPFPRIDTSKPSLGISAQVHGDDLILSISPAKHIVAEDV